MGAVAVATTEPPSSGLAEVIDLDQRRQQRRGLAPPQSGDEPQPAVIRLPVDPISARTIALLRAVATGRAELSCSRIPDLFVDGVYCCNQDTAHEMVADALIQLARPGHLGQRVPARLTSKGAAVLRQVTKPISA